MERARRGHVDGARSEARRAVAEVEVFAVEEVARIEAAELTEEVAADRHEGAVHPVDAVGHAPEPRPEPTERGVEQEMRERPEARRRRLPSAALTRETSAGDARARRARERLDQGGERAGQHARVGIQEHEHVTPRRLRAAVRARREAQVGARLDQPDLRVARAGRPGAPVARGVVDEHHLERGHAARGEAREARVEGRASIPVDDDDRDRHASGQAPSGAGPVIGV